jgi:hypothetical protein
MKKIVLLLFLSTVSQAKDVTLPQSFWNKPAKADNYTALAASFNTKTLPITADMALGNKGIGGGQYKADIKGRFGLAVETTKHGGFMRFAGGSNLSPAAATVRMFVKGKFLAGNKPKTFFSTLGPGYSLAIIKNKQSLNLQILKLTYSSLKEKRVISEIKLLLKDKLAAGKWYSVVVSWDRNKKLGAIFLNGKGVVGKLKFTANTREFLFFMLGSAARAKNFPDGISVPGTAFDELQVYNDWYEQLLKPIRKLSEADEKKLKEMLKAIRDFGHIAEKLQRWGGWEVIYTLPNLFGSEAQGRGLVKYPEHISNDKSHLTALVAARLLYAWQIMGDYRFYDLAKRSCDFFIAAQNKQGYWTNGYIMTVNGVKQSHHGSFKFQDSVQSHPIFLLGYFYRISGEKKYLDAAKRAGELYIKYQNPDGSWSHHGDPKRKIGATARGLPQGGEINDLTANDAIDVMVFMYHLTGEGKYIKAIKRLGEWLIKAELKGTKVRGWAQQYNNKLEPTDARHFEPPAMSLLGTREAIRAMVELYRLSGDRKYLKVLEECRDWHKKQYPKGMYAYYEHKTGRPIAYWKRNTYYLEDPKDLAYIKSVPISSSNAVLNPIPPFDDTLANADDFSFPQKYTEKDILQMQKYINKKATYGLKTISKDGVWAQPWVSNFSASLGAGFSIGQGRILWMLNWVEATRMLKGEIPAVQRGGTYRPRTIEIKRLAWPGKWYNVDWKKH